MRCTHDTNATNRFVDGMGIGLNIYAPNRSHIRRIGFLSRERKQVQHFTYRVAMQRGLLRKLLNKSCAMQTIRLYILVLVEFSEKLVYDCIHIHRNDDWILAMFFCVFGIALAAMAINVFTTLEIVCSEH